MMARIRVVIRNKPGVFDPEGEAITGGIERLGYENVADVQVGKIVDLEIDVDEVDDVEAEIEEICSQFLVNPVIERYSIERSGT
jgi:phosphoribosylformylglycinamidine synthase